MKAQPDRHILKFTSINLVVVDILLSSRCVGNGEATCSPLVTLYLCQV